MMGVLVMFVVVVVVFVALGVVGFRFCCCGGGGSDVGTVVIGSGCGGFECGSSDGRKQGCCTERNGRVW